MPKKYRYKKRSFSYKKRSFKRRPKMMRRRGSRAKLHMKPDGYYTEKVVEQQRVDAVFIDSAGNWSYSLYVTCNSPVHDTSNGTPVSAE